MRSAGGERESRSRWAGGQLAGLVLLVVAALCTVIVANAPAPYGIEQPGPVFDVLGDTTVDGQQAPMIEITGAETHATDGALNMLTVNANDPDNLPSWLQVLESYFDPTRAVLPIDELFPPAPAGQTSDDVEATQMDNSKQAAIAAALSNLGYPHTVTMTVANVEAGLPADGVIEAGDVIVSVDGQALDDVDALRAIVAANGTSKPAVVVVERGGQQLTFPITPVLSDDDPPAPVLGILVASAYDFSPVNVSIQLENVGGPSAGMMFALGIIDKLSPDSLTGGQSVAGTGTIAATGEVGPIGGIVQKMYGAVGAGAKWFLAPETNCADVVGHVPAGLTVAAVGSLDDALGALQAIRNGDPSALQSCDAFVATPSP